MALVRRSSSAGLDEEKGPTLVFADGTQSIYLADLSGDGLTDLVRIRNGEVCYWPNLGYGRFGAKVTMDNSPWFDDPDQFDQKRIRLADIDGSGTTDIIYLARDGVRPLFNQSGNGWSNARASRPVSPHRHLSPSGHWTCSATAPPVWSGPRRCRADARRPMRYVDLMGGQKPHLLGQDCQQPRRGNVVYIRASTKFYLQDKQTGNPGSRSCRFPSMWSSGSRPTTASAATAS